MNQPNRSALTVLKYLAAVVFSVLIVPAAHAATINVTALNDTLSNNGACSIREAIINANSNAATWPDCTAGFGADVINLPAGTITFTIPNAQNAAEELAAKGDLDILSSITINGHTGGTTINGAALDRVIDINPDPDSDGSTPTPLITVHINRLNMTNGRQNDTGGLRVQANSVVTINQSTVSNSVSWANDAGGIGIFSGGSVTLTNSTVSGNTSLLLAAGIKNEGKLTLVSCTVTNNRTTGGTPTRGQGVGSYATPVTLRNTIVAANGSNRPDVEGLFDSHGYNIIGRINDGMNNVGTITPNPGTADQIGINAALINLGALASSGGPTPTHALGAGSIAIDKGNSFGLTVDQRVMSRPSDDAGIPNALGGDGADVGAFEVQAACVDKTCCCRRIGRRYIGTCCPRTLPVFRGR